MGEYLRRYPNLASNLQLAYYGHPKLVRPKIDSTKCGHMCYGSMHSGYNFKGKLNFFAFLSSTQVSADTAYYWKCVQYLCKRNETYAAT